MLVDSTLQHSFHKTGGWCQACKTSQETVTVADTGVTTAAVQPKGPGFKPHCSQRAA